MTLGVTAADTGTVARLTSAVEDFRQDYERLHDIKWGAQISRSGDNQLIHDYGKAMWDSEKMKNRIEAVTGAWEGIKQWAGLAALPLIPIAIALGLIAAISTAVLSIRSFMRRADIVLAIKQDPSLTYKQAAGQVDARAQGTISKALDVAQLGFFAVLAFVAYKLFSRR